MGPRSCERGNRRGQRFKARSPEWLQWGRARASAEIAAERENMASICRLQWGRARASAEMSAQLSAQAHSTLLQWGRARASAEMNPHHDAPVATETASMGPRSCERGNRQVVNSWG